jgi:hypothetical protein
LFGFVVAGVAGLDVTLEFTREPQDVVAVRSKPLVLQCAVSNSAPGPVNITWTHEGEPLPLVNDSRRYLLPNGSLFFRKVSFGLETSICTPLFSRVIFYVDNCPKGHPSGLVVRVPGYRSRGPGFDSGSTRFSEK